MATSSITDVTDRTSLYTKILLNGNKELDYLDQTLTSLSLPSMTTIKLTLNYVNRLDILAYTIYGTPNLWWLICFVNNIINPLTDTYVGMPLVLPNLQDYYSFFNKNTIADTTGATVFALPVLTGVNS